jgi:hypothetical protein
LRPLPFFNICRALSVGTDRSPPKGLIIGFVQLLLLNDGLLSNTRVGQRIENQIDTSWVSRSLSQPREPDILIPTY